MLDSIYAHTPIADLVTERAWVQAMLDVESALTTALASMDEIPPQPARRIAEACDVDRYDVDSLARQAALHATPVVGLVQALREQVPESDRPYVHVGATSQDIVDTALMLIAKRALTPLLATSEAAAWTLFGLAQEHRHTPMIARTLLRQALPITFGLRAAIWLDGIDSARARLRTVQETGLAVQMGGAVGGRAPELGTRVALELGLADPVIGWSATRVRTAELASALGRAGGRVRQGRARRDAARAGRDRRGLRGRQRRRRRLELDGAQAQSGRGGLDARVHAPGPRPGRDRAGRDGDRARASGRRLAGRVGDARRPVDADRIGRQLDRGAGARDSASTPIGWPRTCARRSPATSRRRPGSTS